MPEEDEEEQRTRAWFDAGVEEKVVQMRREDAEQRARKWIAEFQQDILGDDHYTRALSELTDRPLTEVVHAVHWALTHAAPTVEDVATRFVACVEPLKDITNAAQVSAEMHAEVAANVSETYAELMQAYIGRIGVNLNAWAQRNTLGEDGTN